MAGHIFQAVCYNLCWLYVAKHNIIIGSQLIIWLAANPEDDIKDCMPKANYSFRNCPVFTYLLKNYLIPKSYDELYR